MTNNAEMMLLSMLQQIKANPVQFLLQRRLNIPPNIQTNDPNEILNYLISSGQISQERINQAYMAAQNMRR